MATTKLLRWEREYLRDLAKEKLEIAHLPIMQERIKHWTAHNDLQDKKPIVTFEVWTIQDEGFHASCRCETPYARAMEQQLHSAMINHKRIGDDTVVTPDFVCRWGVHMEPFNLPVKHERCEGSIGFHIVEQIKDLETDMHLLQKSKMYYGRQKTKIGYRIAEETFGDILTVRYGSPHLGASVTNNIVQRMGMENMFVAMMETPKAFHQMMKRISGDYVRFFKGIESRGMLWSNNGNDGVCQGTYAFTNQLPVDLCDPSSIKTTDCWGYLDSQETVGVSPEMFNTFYFPYYKRIADLFGLLSYGCCEPVHGIWDLCLSKLPNLRKVSISKWCDQRFMAERLAGSNTIFLRKPDPNLIGVDKYLDEDAFRKHIRETVDTAKGCILEFAYRDVYNLSGELNKPRRAVEIIREEIERF